MTDNTSSRTDASGEAYAASQRQIQIYVNRRTDELSSHIAEALNDHGAAISPRRIAWVSPLPADGYREYHDSAFLQKVGLTSSAAALRAFWPAGGPVWDALGVANDCAGVLLVEAKSHPPEVYGPGCRTGRASRRKIDAALERTGQWLGAPPTVDWTGPLYQSANRLAHLCFLRRIIGVPAWLVNVYFLDDPPSPTTLPQWTTALAEVKSRLGLADAHVPYAADVFLPACDRLETP